MPQEERDASLSRVLAQVAQLTERAQDHAARHDAHTDAMTIWMVALSTGALVGLFPALSRLVSLETLSQARVGRLLAPFVCATVLGVGHRFAMAGVMRSTAHRWLFLTGSLGMAAAIPSEHIVAILPEIGKLLGISLQRAGTTVYERERRWRRWAAILSLGMYVAFLAGVLQAALFIAGLAQ